MGQSVFEKIAAGEFKSYTIWQDELYMAFLDINPLTEGHTLVVPKRNPGDYIFDLANSEYLQLMEAAKNVAELLKSKIKCDRVVMLVEGFAVPHVHVHLIPVNRGFTLNSCSPMKVTEDDLERVYSAIINNE